MMNAQIALKRGSMLLAMLVALFILPARSIPVVQAITTQADTHWGEMPLYFVPNQGQMDNRIAYYVQGSDKTLYFTSAGIIFALTDLAASTTLSPISSPGLSKDKSDASSRWIVKLDFVNANSVTPGGQTETGAVLSYFKGSPDKWQTGLPTYSKIVYSNLWEGIDLVYSGTVNRLKHEFIVQPGVDPARIQLAYRGATVQVNKAGQLDVNTPVGGFLDDAPIAYQTINGQRVPVSAAFVLENAADKSYSYGFKVGAYNPSLPLVIDPEVLVYCGFIGGNGGNGDFGTAIAVDATGNAYVTGYTESTEATFPVTVGPDLTFNVVVDAFVAKVKADGTGLVYAGYIGGDSYDYGNGIAVDSEGNAYIAGDTESTQSTFPVTVGPDLTFNSIYGYRDAFVAKVNPEGTGLVYAGYIGGSGHDAASAIALDSAGNVYITGNTGTVAGHSDTFPVIVGPGLTRYGAFDVFAAKVKADGTGLIYAGYIGSGIGGYGVEDGTGIAVDSAGNAYITGYTTSGDPSFPVIVGPDFTFNGGLWDAFVTKVKADGTGLAYSGFIGGDEDDYGTGIAVDTGGNAYVTGYTNSSQSAFPVIAGPDLTYNGTPGAFDFDAFVVKVKADGTGLMYAGYIGGNDYDFGDGIAVDSAGNAYITGSTDSTQATFPVINGPDLTHNGYDDAFVAKVKADGTGLVYSGYIGGNSGDGGHSISIDLAGNVYITGDTCTAETTFPVVGGPDLTFNNGYFDAFVAKISYVVDKTLTVNSIPANDGWIVEKSEKSNTGGSLNVVSATLRLGDDNLKKQYRSILSFNTGAALPDTAVITNATLKIKKSGVIGSGNPVTLFQRLMVDIKTGSFGTSALQASDFQAAASKVYGPLTPVFSGGWYSLDLTNGKDYINRLSTLSGLTQIRLRFKLDDNNNAVANYLNLYSGNAKAAYRPQLILTYYIP